MQQPSVELANSEKLQFSQEGAASLSTPSTIEEALNLNGTKKDVDEIRRVEGSEMIRMLCLPKCRVSWGQGRGRGWCLNNAKSELSLLCFIIPKFSVPRKILKYI